MSRNIVTRTNQDGSLSPEPRGVDLGRTFSPETVEAQIDSTTATTLKALVENASDFAEFKAAIEAL